MKIFSVVTILLMFFASTVFSEPEIKGTPAELSGYLQELPGSVVLSAEGTIEINSESALAVVIVITKDASFKNSLEKNQNIKNEMVKKLNSLGISNERITETKFSSTPQYRLFAKKPSGFKVENKLKIIVNNEKEFQIIASMIDSYKDVYYSELTINDKNEETNKLKALEKAFDNLLKKKAIFEKRMKITLVPRDFNLSNYAGNTSYSGNKRYESKNKRTSSNLSYIENSPFFGELIYKSSLNIEFIVKNN